MNKKFLNSFLYVVAAGFLLWHLLPLFAIGRVVAPTEKTNAELAANTMCYGGGLDVPTFGDPLKDPLITTLNQKNSVLNYTDTAERIVLNPYPTTPDESPDASWQADHYGNNTPIFISQRQASGASALRVELVDYIDGDAKWQTQKISVTPGEMLSFNTSYRTNQKVVASVTLTQSDGTEKYITLKQLSASEDWQNQTSTVIVPNGTVSLRFSTILNTTGWLETKNYAVSRMNAPKFQRGIATFTFDDGWKSVYNQGLPLFDKYGIKTTQFIVADYDVNEAYMTPEQIRELQKQGHDIGSHSYSHADHSKLQGDELILEVAGSRAVLNSKFGGVNNFAAPFGRYNQDVTKMIRKCYQSHRTTDTGFNAPGYDRYQIKVQNVEVDTTPEQIREWAQFAQNNNLWLVLVYHQVEDGGEYSVDTNALESHLRAVKDTGIHIDTYEKALIETYSQGR